MRLPASARGTSDGCCMNSEQKTPETVFRHKGRCGMEMELLLEIHVICHEAISVKGATKEKVMIPFEGTAEGPFFTGRIIGPGVDTQTITDNGILLSARYMLEGKDAAGKDCRIFVENQGNGEKGFRPEIVTDSEALKEWETSVLSATVEGAPGGVTVRIFR